MIVKDEAHIIKETLDSILKYIDYWVICDTGSTDNTKSLIIEYFKEKNIKGELFEHKWVDFAHNRTKAFECAYNKSDYVWVIDADDLIVGNLVLPSKLNADAYVLHYGEYFKYVRTQIFNNRLKWCYRGILHEFPQLVSKQKSNDVMINGDYYIDSRRLGARNKDKDKYLKDAHILLKAIEDNKDPDLISRYYFYVAQSFRDYKDYENAIKYYHIRIELGGWIEEVAFAWLQIANMMQLVPNKYSNNEIIEAYKNSYKLIPEKAESLYELANFYFKLNEFEKAYGVMKMVANLPYPVKYTLFTYKNIYDKDAKLKLELFKKYVDLKKEQDKFILDGYDFLPNKDYIGNDIQHYPNLSISDLKYMADNNPNCIGFNSLGYLKSAIPKENSINLFNQSLSVYNGFYIKKNNNNIILPQTILKTRKILCLYLGYAPILNDELTGIHNRAYGSELAAIKLMEYFKDTYDIYIINQINRCYHTIINGINYITLIEFNRKFDKTNTIDVLILSRFINYFLDCSFKYDKCFIWVHDIIIASHYNNTELCDKGMHLIHNMINKIDGIIVLSEWHKNIFINTYKLNEYINKVFIIGNGINTDLFLQNSHITKQKNRFIYTSCYNRGIEKLVEYIHKIHEIYPDTELHIYRDFNGHENFVNSLKQYNYIFVHGKVDNQQLVEEFSKSEYWFYPTTFPETYCISALEAQMAGCVCIANNYAAINTTVGERGLLYYQNRDNILEQILDLMKDTDKKNYYIDITKKWAIQQDWYNVHQKWDWLINNFNNVQINNINNSYNYEYVCINLQKRIDRKHFMLTKFKEANITNFRFIEAINGADIPELDIIKYIFRNNDFNYRSNVIGCALSHIKTYFDLINSNYEYYVILEDDVSFTNNIQNKIHTCINNLADIDLLYLGYTNYKIQTKEKYNNINFVSLNNQSIGGGLFGYILSKKGAFKILEHIKNYGIRKAIDHVIFDNELVLNKGIVEPLFVKTLSVQFDNNFDSDIQVNNNTIFNNVNRVFLDNELLKKLDYFVISKITTVIDNIPIYWINLNKSLDRKDFMEKQFNKYYITNHTRIQAIDGDELNIKYYNIDDNLNKYELACVLSHIKAIQKAYDDKCDMALIMEDDCSFEYIDKYNFSPLKLLCQNKNIDILQLSIILHTNQFNEFIKLPNIVYKGNFDSGCCYLITRNGMNKILSLNNKLNVADEYLYKNVDTYVTYPYFTYINKFNSTIQHNNTNYEYISKKLFDEYYDLNKNKLKLLKQKDKVNIFINKCALSYSEFIVNNILNIFNNYTIVLDYKHADLIINHICDNYNLDINDTQVHIIISGESIHINKLVDVFIGPILNNNNSYYHIYYPQAYSSLYEHKKSINKDDYIKTKTKFCAFMYSNYVHERVKIFNLINLYKKVDSLGKVCNNVNIIDSRNIYNDNETYNDIAVNLYSDYKFVIAMENNCIDGYFTEKIFNPLIANCIPIYWGHPSIFNYINKKRVIYIPDFNTQDELLNFIKFIDTNDYEYNKIINEPWFVNDNNIENVNKKLLTDLTNIFL